ncbi:MAG: hypothetical protein M0R51_13255, partial [Clostridia bacterium]|nr:hypothetical protein [Clostridia bacterium]
ELSGDDALDFIEYIKNPIYTDLADQCMKEALKNYNNTFLYNYNQILYMKDCCFNCKHWSGKHYEQVELCKKHKIFMRGSRIGCLQYRHSAKNDISVNPSYYVLTPDV